MRKIIFTLIVLLCSLSTMAQDLEDYLSKYTSENGKNYLQPFAYAFSADLNSGLFHNATIKKKGFQLYIGVVSQIAIIPDKSKFFTAHIDDPAFGSPRDVPNAPTLFGPDEGVLVENSENGLQMYLPAGFDIDYLPMALPQITIGSVLGSDFTVRYMSFSVEDFGDIDMFGWGIRHSINQYAKSLPLSLAIAYYHQRFTVGEYLDAKTNVIGLQASYDIPIITFYGGLSYENGSLDVEYTYEGSDSTVDNGDKISFILKEDGNIRATLGLCLNLGPLKVHGDYNMARQNTFALGLGIGFNQK